MVSKTLNQFISSPKQISNKAFKGNKIQDHFEGVLANICGALGFAVMFGGTLLSNTGIDFIAFEKEAAKAYVFSVTVSNDTGVN